MKAVYHILIGDIFLASAIISDLLNGWTAAFFLLERGLSYSTILVAVLLYNIGLIMPDSDKPGSMIFYTIFMPLAWALKAIELPVAALLRRKIGHRESLHTMIGLAVTSFIAAILMFIVHSSIETIPMAAIPFYFLASILGQLMHLLCDFHFALR